MNIRAGLVIATSAIGLPGASGAIAGPLIVPVTAIGSSSYRGDEASNAVDQGAGSDISDWASLGQGVGSNLRLDLGSAYSLRRVYAADRVTSGGDNSASTVS